MLNLKSLRREQAAQLGDKAGRSTTLAFRFLKLKVDPDVAAALSPEELEARFDLDYHHKHIDTIFARVFGAG